MKRTVTRNLIFFLLSLVLFSCEKNLICGKDQEYLKREQGILYYKGSPFSGKLTCYQGIKPRKQITKISTNEELVETVYDEEIIGSIERYKEGKVDGEWLSYHDNGEVSTRKLYKEGKRDGVWEYFNKDGSLSKKEVFKDGNFIGN